MQETILIFFYLIFPKHSTKSPTNTYCINFSSWHKSYNWISDFLHNRQQKVLLDNENSCVSSILSGVPWGSVSGPVLFLLYINGLPAKISSIIRLYADDIILYRKINSEEDIFNSTRRLICYCSLGSKIVNVTEYL